MPRNRRLACLTLSLSVAAGGCASSTGGSRSWFGGWFGSSAPATSSYLAGTQPQGTGTLSKIGNSITSTFSKAAGALTPGPTDQPDAISLSHRSKMSGDSFVAVAKYQESKGDFAAAEEQYNKALELTPNHNGALLGLALLNDRQGRYEQAVHYYTLAAEDHPNQAAVLNNLGLCYSRQDKPEEAAAVMRKAVELQPLKVLYRNNLASALVDAGQTDEAVAVLSAVHGEGTAHYNVGYLLIKKGNKTGALAQFQQSLAKDSSLVDAQTWADQLSQELSLASNTGLPSRGANPDRGSATKVEWVTSEASPAPTTAPVAQPTNLQPDASQPSSAPLPRNVLRDVQ